jgi:hypothetical protein
MVISGFLRSRRGPTLAEGTRGIGKTGRAIGIVWSILFGLLLACSSSGQNANDAGGNGGASGGTGGATAAGGNGGTVTGTPGCLSTTPCTATSTCPAGQECNINQTPPVCATLYCQGPDGPCSDDAQCKTGLNCLEGQCIDKSTVRSAGEPCTDENTVRNGQPVPTYLTCDTGLICRVHASTPTASTLILLYQCGALGAQGDQCTSGTVQECQSGLACQGIISICETATAVVCTVGTCSPPTGTGSGGASGGSGAAGSGGNAGSGGGAGGSVRPGPGGAGGT